MKKINDMQFMKIVDETAEKIYKIKDVVMVRTYVTCINEDENIYVIDICGEDDTTSNIFIKTITYQNDNNKMHKIIQSKSKKSILYRNLENLLFNNIIELQDYNKYINKVDKI